MTNGHEILTAETPRVSYSAEIAKLRDSDVY